MFPESYQFLSEYVRDVCAMNQWVDCTLIRKREPGNNLNIYLFGIGECKFLPSLSETFQLTAFFHHIVFIFGEYAFTLYFLVMETGLNRIQLQNTFREHRCQSMVDLTLHFWEDLIQKIFCRVHFFTEYTFILKSSSFEVGSSLQ